MSKSCSDSSGNDAAKKIFLEHGGSGFFMARSGIYEAYKKMNIDSREEKEWARERIAELLTMPISPKTLIDGSFGNLIELIKNADDSEGLESLMDKVECLDAELDTISLLLVAESLLGLLHAAKHDRILYYRHLIDREKGIVARLLARAREMKINVAAEYQEDEYMKDILSNTDVLERIENDTRGLERCLDI